ncbi:DUF934 domain-containing protein [Pseudoduganella sp. GCM10020061]|uniref:DUF934 domain-containing protein n=1 Tax=Pseudoduganella sp. GCM10020061 TaxID=3317345 RepID=UPI00363C079D
MLEKHKLVIKGREVVADDWAVLRLDEGADAATVEVPEGKVIVPLAVWEAQKDALAARRPLGVWLPSDTPPDALKGQLDAFDVVAVDFPRFSDGRGYSIAYNLRMRLGWKGELRAIGDVLRDQLFSMQRVGFDCYATRQDRSIHDALKGLTVFSETYQASVDNSLPLYRRQVRTPEAA